MRSLHALKSFFATQPGTAPIAGDRWIVAFSGGNDSTALLLATASWAATHGVEVVAAHLDHGLDPGSSARAQSAARLARRIGVPFHGERRAVNSRRRGGESLEAAARRVRYRFLDELRRNLGASGIATAHHRDDQVETVLMRILQGSGLEGLAAIQPRRGFLSRPLLDLPRAALQADVEEAGLDPIDDPTNRDEAALRNRVRHTLLPQIAARYPSLPDQLTRLARATGEARGTIQAPLLAALRPRCRLSPFAAGSRATTIVVLRSSFQQLHQALRPHALALLHRLAAAPYPASRAAVSELARQLASGGRLGCDCGHGWRWEEHHGELTLAKVVPPTPRFSYTLKPPGEIDLPEVGLRFRLRRGPVAAWMFSQQPLRAGLALKLKPGQRVTIRNRRPGDRVQPLGHGKPSRLKEILIDNRVPRTERDALPLLTAAGRIVWVPGVMLDEECRLGSERETWIAEWVPSQESERRLNRYPGYSATAGPPTASRC